MSLSGVARGVRRRELAGSRFGVVIRQPRAIRHKVVIAGNQTRVAVEQLTAVDRTRLGESHGLLKWEEMREIDTALVLVLGLAS